MWDLDDRLNHILFEEEVEVEPFRRGEIVATKVNGEEKSGTYLSMSGSGKARVRGDDGVIYHMDPKVLYLPAEERKAKVKAALEKTEPLDVDEKALEKVEEYFRKQAVNNKLPIFEREYAERILDVIDRGITRDKVRKLLRAAKKERLRQHSYEKRGDRRARTKYRALERAIFYLDQLL